MLFQAKIFSTPPPRRNFSLRFISLCVPQILLTTRESPRRSLCIQTSVPRVCTRVVRGISSPFTFTFTKSCNSPRLIFCQESSILGGSVVHFTSARYPYIRETSCTVHSTTPTIVSSFLSRFTSFVMCSTFHLYCFSTVVACISQCICSQLTLYYAYDIVSAFL